LLEDEYSFGLNKIADIYPTTTWRPSFYVNVSRTVLDPTWAESAARAVKETTSFLSVAFISHIIAESDLPENVYLVDPLDTRGRPNLPVWSQDIVHGVSKYGSSMTAVLQIAVYMGFNPIYLLGCDGEYVQIDWGGSDPNHFSEDYDKLQLGKRKIVMTASMASFCSDAVQRGHEVAKYACDALGVEIYNATVGGEIEIYPRVDIREVLNDIRCRDRQQS
jgi:hypothetical protein